jgi:hypothetical protein
MTARPEENKEYSHFTKQMIARAALEARFWASIGRGAKSIQATLEQANEDRCSTVLF